MKKEIYKGNKIARCYHQDVPLYYASNKGMNETEYMICFKCRRLVKI